MLFNSFTYLVFLPLVFFIYWLIPPRLRTWFLLIASYVFYMNWIPKYGILILFLTIVNYLVGLLIAKTEKRKKLVLIAGLSFNLITLCFFKYAGFLLESLWSLFNFFNNSSVIKEPAINILLPLGISFFTFEFIHYIVDVYKGSTPIKNFKDFALFAAFFPSQIAGPIKRYQNFIDQLKHPLALKQIDFRSGIFLILQGLYKKIVLGDNLGSLVNYGFTHIGQLGVPDAWLAVAGFTFQIFFDFSGYTDIGRGSALLFGYKVPENFNWPFIAANLTDFWRRWHISLSTWLRDYLFIPLGGSRGSHWLVRRNLLITMMLGGLWHGAAWHYVIWGAFHGMGLIASKDWHDFVSKYNTLSHWRETKVWHYLGIVYTLFFIFIAGILFRADSLKNSWLLLANMFYSPAGANHELTQLFLESTVPFSLTVYMLFLGWRSMSQHISMVTEQGDNFVLSSSRRMMQYWDNSFVLRLATYVSIGLIILGFAPEKMAPFIYFQF